MKQAIKKILFGDGDQDYLFHRGILKGLRFRTNPLHKLQRIFGLDEREIESITRRYAAAAKSAIDVGANDGWYSLFFAARENITKVVSCEPDPQYEEAFMHNFKINPQVNSAKVKSLRCFVGTAPEANFTTIDQIATDLPEPVLLKIDVDGAEMDVLRSAAETLRNKNVLVVLETHSLQLEKECTAFLEEAGYSVVIDKNAWYRAIIKDQRPIEHNRWLHAEK